MKKMSRLQHRFVEFLPEKLEAGTLYISMQYATASHKCCCGCGRDVVTPISPTDWQLMFDGKTISLKPSIGNWSYPCRSHYWIKGNRVVWDGTPAVQPAPREIGFWSKIANWRPWKR
jgi:Family of unknown function (DUF6527)